MDILSSQRFKEAPLHTLFHKDDPVEVLRTSQIADDRAKAMLVVKEPKERGGTDAEQFEMLQILATAATSDKHARCRLCAISALGRWQDPRAAQILIVAYHNAPYENPEDKIRSDSAGVVQALHKTRPFGPASAYTDETIIAIRCAALEALGKKRTPEGFTLLCDLATKPVKREVKQTEFDALVGSNATTGQDQVDLRLAAIRALADYKGDLNAAQVLHKVMTTEHTINLKGRAYDSLVKVSGQSYEPASPEWATYLQKGQNQQPGTMIAGGKNAPATVVGSAPAQGPTGNGLAQPGTNVIQPTGVNNGTTGGHLSSPQSSNIQQPLPTPNGNVPAQPASPLIQSAAIQQPNGGPVQGLGYVNPVPAVQPFAQPTGGNMGISSGPPMLQQPAPSLNGTPTVMPIVQPR